MRAVLWLAGQDLKGRLRATLTGALLVALAAALCAGVEMTARAGELAVARRTDAISEPVRVVRAGVTSFDLARHDVAGRTLPPAVIYRLRKVLPGEIRAVEGRSLFRLQLGGQSTLLLGVDPADTHIGLAQVRRLGAGEIAAGKALGDKLKLKVGAAIHVGSKRLRVASLLPMTGSALDHRLVARRDDLPPGDHELRVYPMPGVEPDRLASRIRATIAGVGAIASERPSAKEALDGTLSRYRLLLYLTLALVGSLCLLTWAHVDTSGRRNELATLRAIGVTRRTMLAAITLRLSVITITGAVAGAVVGISLGLLSSRHGASPLLGSAATLALQIGAIAAGLALVGTTPAALINVNRSGVAALQDPLE